MFPRRADRKRQRLEVYPESGAHNIVILQGVAIEVLDHWNLDRSFQDHAFRHELQPRSQKPGRAAGVGVPDSPILVFARIDER